MDALGVVLYCSQGDQRDRCFSPAFLKWLTALDPGLDLADLDGVSAPDFEDLAAPTLDRLLDPLHGFFARRGEIHVLWQLARVVGLVARQRRGSPTCPELWNERHPVLYRLFAQIASIDQPLLQGQPAKPSWRVHRRGLRSPPRVVWEVDLQQVLALLPEQVLGPEIREVNWRVIPGQEVLHPPTWTLADGRRRVEETRSQALAPADSYLIETELGGRSSFPTALCSIELPDGFTPCVLFAADGTMLGIGADSPLPPGDYLALVRRVAAPRLFQLRGVRQTERIEFAPVGWHGWQGWRLRLDPGADVAPYIVEAESRLATWEVELPPAAEVRWREALAVHVGRWPRLLIPNSEPFNGAIIEVAREPAVRADLFLVIGKTGGVPVRSEGNQCFLDLGSVAALDGYYGTVRLTCRPPSQPGAPALTARFIRLPQMSLAYVPDPARLEQALAVRIQGKAEMLAAFAPDADTEIVRDPEGIVLCAKVPHVSPGVAARLAPYKAVVRVRVPATRVGLVTEAHGFLGWRGPPFCDLDLSTVELGDRLRIELHEEPLLEDKRLLCRLIGGDEIAAGSSIGSGGPVWQFEVDLHRWRDTFGLSVGGTIQVRTSRRWVDIVRLREPAAPAASVIRPEPMSERGRLVIGLEKALTQDDLAEVRRVAAQCLRHTADIAAKPVDRELLLLAVARSLTAAVSSPGDLHEAERCLVELGDRPDLPEAQMIRRTVGLRLEARSGRGQHLSKDQLDRLTTGLPDIPQTLLFHAECWYQFARHAQSWAKGAWQDCRDRSESCLPKTGVFSSEGGTVALSLRGAILLRAVARLMLGMEPDLPSFSFTQATLTNAWLAGLHLAAQTVRLPLSRASPED